LAFLLGKAKEPPALGGSFSALTAHVRWAVRSVDLPFFRNCSECSTVHVMSTTSEQTQPNCDHLASLHPDYSQLELMEAQAQLRQYFDLAWGVFSRMEEKKRDLNLTTTKVNSMVNPPSGSEDLSNSKT
jgi:glutaredoxin-related protein